MTAGSNIGGGVFALEYGQRQSSYAISQASALPADAPAGTPDGLALGVGTMGAYGANGLAAGSYSLQTAANFQFDTTGQSVLTLGLLSALTQGTGLAGLALTVSADGATLFSQTFANLADAQLFFADNTVTLGMLGAGSHDVLVAADFLLNGAGGFGFQYALVSSVPEPSSWQMLLLGLGALAQRAARRTRR